MRPVAVFAPLRSAAAWSRRLVPPVLGEGPFRLLFAGQALSLLGDAVTPVALAFGVLQIGGTATQLGVVLAAGSLPTVAFALSGGVWGDRLPRQRIMLARDLVRMGVQASLAALLLSGHAHLWELIGLQVVRGGATAFFRPAATGLLPQLVSGPRLQQANALIGLIRNGAGIIGPGAAGFLVALTSPGWAIAVDAASFGLSAACLVAIRPARPSAPGGPPARARFLQDLRTGWEAVRSRTWVWVSLLAFALFNFVVFGALNVLGPIVAARRLGGAPAWGEILAVSGAGAVAGGVLALRVRPRWPLRVLAAAFCCSAPELALLAAAAPVAAILSGALLAGMALALADAVWETALQEQVPAGVLSRVSAYDWVASLALLPLGLALAGPVADRFGLPRTLWAATAWALMIGIIMLATPSIRRLTRPHLDMEGAAPATTA